jgi:hypothetical protein
MDEDGQPPDVSSTLTSTGAVDSDMPSPRAESSATAPSAAAPPASALVAAVSDRRGGLRIVTVNDEPTAEQIQELFAHGGSPVGVASVPVALRKLLCVVVGNSAAAEGDVSPVAARTRLVTEWRRALVKRRCHLATPGLSRRATRKSTKRGAATPQPPAPTAAHGPPGREPTVSASTSGASAASGDGGHPRTVRREPSRKIKFLIDSRSEVERRVDVKVYTTVAPGSTTVMGLDPGIRNAWAVALSGDVDSRLTGQLLVVALSS